MNDVPWCLYTEDHMSTVKVSDGIVAKPVGELGVLSVEPSNSRAVWRWRFPAGAAVAVVRKWWSKVQRTS